MGKKYNKYTMLLKTVQSTLDPSLSVAIPVHYEMKGYNTLLGSHYDHYFLDYTVRINMLKIKSSEIFRTDFSNYARC